MAQKKETPPIHYTGRTDIPQAGGDAPTKYPTNTTGWMLGSANSRSTAEEVIARRAKETGTYGVNSDVVRNRQYQKDLADQH